LDCGPLQGHEWGYNIILTKNRGGFLTEFFPGPNKSIWTFEGIYAFSRHIPHVRLPGLIHPGLIGTMPSKEILDSWNKRENELF